MVEEFVFPDGGNIFDMNMKKYVSNLPLIVVLAMSSLLSGCAVDANKPETNYCPWSNDNSRWGSDRSDWSNALLAKAFGLKEEAANYVTGGQLDRSRVYDNKGHIIEVVRNQRGITSVQDFTAACYLTPNGYAQRQVGVYSYHDLIQMKVLKY